MGEQHPKGARPGPGLTPEEAEALAREIQAVWEPPGQPPLTEPIEPAPTTPRGLGPSSAPPMPEPAQAPTAAPASIAPGPTSPAEPTYATAGSKRTLLGFAPPTAASSVPKRTLIGLSPQPPGAPSSPPQPQPRSDLEPQPRSDLERSVAHWAAGTAEGAQGRVLGEGAPEASSWLAAAKPPPTVMTVDTLEALGHRSRRRRRFVLAILGSATVLIIIAVVAGLTRPEPEPPSDMAVAPATIAAGFEALKIPPPMPPDSIQVVPVDEPSVLNSADPRSLTAGSKPPIQAREGEPAPAARPRPEPGRAKQSSASSGGSIVREIPF